MYETGQRKGGVQVQIVVYLKYIKHTFSMYYKYNWSSSAAVFGIRIVCQVYFFLSSFFELQYEFIQSCARRKTGKSPET
jgi:hypothetical protein